MKLRIGQRLGIVVAMMAVALLLMAAGSLWQLRVLLLDGKQEKVRTVVEAALSVAQRYRSAEVSGVLSAEQARAAAIAALRAFRYEGDNYVWINDMHSLMVMHPVRPDLEGQDVKDYRDQDGQPIFRKFVEVARGGGGFAFYLWPKPGTFSPERKISYVAPFEPWGWVIGSGIYVGDVDQVFRSRAGHFGLFVALVIAGAIILSTMVARSITVPLAKITGLTVRLSKGDTAIEVPDTQGESEIADLARALDVFKEDARRAEELRRIHADEQRRAAEELRASEERVRLLLDSTGDGIYGIDADGCCSILNPAAVRMLGYDSSDDLLGRPAHAVMHHHRADGSHYPAEECPVHRCLVEGTPARVADEVFFRADGTSFPVEYSANPIYRGEKIIGAVVGFTDITERLRAGEAMKIARTVFETTTDGIVVTDAHNRIKTVNPAFERLTGYGRDEVIGQTPAILASGRHGSEFYAAMWNDLRQDGHWQGQIWNKRKNGDLYAEWLTITAIIGKDGQPAEYVAIFSDITTRAHAAERVRREADFDPLTELPNRRCFIRRLSRQIEVARAGGHHLALLFVDLDRFKPVNDELGHEAGDTLLIEVAGRLKSCVRNTDEVGRMGGDEFVVLLDTVTSPQDAARVADKIIEAIGEDFAVQGRPISIGASIGIALFPQHGDDSQALIQRADAAMYKAKGAGRSTYRMAGEG